MVLDGKYEKNGVRVMLKFHGATGTATASPAGMLPTGGGPPRSSYYRQTGFTRPSRKIWQFKGDSPL